MTRSAYNRAARRDERVQRRMRDRLARWVLVAERLASVQWYPQRDQFARDDAAAFVVMLRDAIALDEREALREALDVLDDAQISIRGLRQILSDARIAPETRGDEVAFRALELDVFDRTREDEHGQDRALDMFERACLIVRTSWVAIAIDGGRRWVWDGDSIETWLRVRELRGAPVRGVDALASAPRELREPLFRPWTWIRAFSAESWVRSLAWEVDDGQ